MSCAEGPVGGLNWPHTRSVFRATSRIETVTQHQTTHGPDRLALIVRIAYLFKAGINSVAQA